MSAEVVSLQELRLTPEPTVVEALTDLLARAERGEIRGFTFSASAYKGRHSTLFVLGDGSLADLIVANLRLQQRLLEYEGA